MHAPLVPRPDAGADWMGDMAHVCRDKAECSSGCKSRPGKGRPSRVATSAMVEVTKPSEPEGQQATSGRPATQ